MTRPLRKVETVVAPLDEADPIARRVLAGVRQMVVHEVERLKVPAPRVIVRGPDGEIMRACRKVAEASDRLAQAKFSSGEIPARQALERAAQNLQRVMRKHGRMPGAEGRGGLVVAGLLILLVLGPQLVRTIGCIRQVVEQG
ncbi:hypothetical protein [Chelativorans sp. M5D2P16]|uniref:hypothetical protein n=1 Tax=Chelativorans sp. M5D2P16 TaxID=3095678 RepID=UPI002ACAE939|nr:hypothetical protein [Chelativorans sp. M5D2P16]MDZ5697827.1 hypothetical protein [Chelativorans sp. M5D2P16]